MKYVYRGLVMHTEIMSVEDIADQLTQFGSEGWRVISYINQGRTSFVLLEQASAQVEVADWNARGAADIAKVEAELSQMMGATASGPYLKNLGRALRTLDR